MDTQPKRTESCPGTVAGGWRGLDCGPSMRRGHRGGGWSPPPAFSPQTVACESYPSHGTCPGSCPSRIPGPTRETLTPGQAQGHRCGSIPCTRRPCGPHGHWEMRLRREELPPFRLRTSCCRPFAHRPGLARPGGEQPKPWRCPLQGCLSGEEGGWPGLERSVQSRAAGTAPWAGDLPPTVSSRFRLLMSGNNTVTGSERPGGEARASRAFSPEASL